MRVLILGDGQGWIVDRIVRRMAKGIPCEFTIDSYTSISQQEFIKQSKSHDLIHYGNWDIRFHYEVLGDLQCPLLLSIRSHRYYPLVKEAVKKVARVHVVNRQLLMEFPEATYIPYGIDDQFFARPFRVGFAGRPEEYKGFLLIEQACEELGVEFHPATGSYKPDEMMDYYTSIDLYVCASVAEGYSTPVMECLAANVPIITTDVGAPSSLNVVKIDRSVEGIKQGILRFYTRPQVDPEFRWEVVNAKFYQLYKDVVDVHSSRSD